MSCCKQVIYAKYSTTFLHDQNFLTIKRRKPNSAEILKKHSCLNKLFTFFSIPPPQKKFQYFKLDNLYAQ